MRLVTGVKFGVCKNETAAVVAGVLLALVDLMPATMPKGRLFIAAAVRVSPEVKVVLGVVMVSLVSNA